MKDNLIKWVLALILDKLKISSTAVWIIAAVIMGVSYGAGYFNEICGGCLPAWVGDWQLRVGVLVGSLLQARTTETLSTSKHAKK